MPQLKIYRFLEIQLAFFLWLAFAPDRNDFYPFYSWAMFTEATQHNRDSYMIIESLGQKTNLALDLIDNSEVWPTPLPKKAYFSVRALGDLFNDKNPQKYLEKEAEILSAAFSTVDNVTYSLYLRKTDRLSFASERKVLHQERLTHRSCKKGTNGFTCSDI